MNTFQIVKRAFLAAAVILTMGTAAIQSATASVIDERPIERPLAGDGQETHGGKG